MKYISFCVSKLSIDLFFKLPVNRYLAINIEGKIGQPTIIRTSSFDISRHVKLMWCKLTNLNVMGNDLTGRCFSNYHHMVASPYVWYTLIKSINKTSVCYFVDGHETYYRSSEWRLGKRIIFFMGGKAAYPCLHHFGGTWNFLRVQLYPRRLLLGVQ